MSKEFKNLKNKIDIASQMLCDIHKLVSMANKYCKAQKKTILFMKYHML